MKNKRITYLLNALSVTSLMVLMAFQMATSGKNVFTTVNVELSQPVDQYFLTTTDIERLIESAYDSAMQITIKEINIKMLEDSIEQIPFVEKAEVD